MHTGTDFNTICSALLKMACFPIPSPDSPPSSFCCLLLPYLFISLAVSISPSNTPSGFLNLSTNKFKNKSHYAMNFLRFTTYQKSKVLYRDDANGNMQATTYKYIQLTESLSIKYLDVPEVVKNENDLPW